MPDLVVIIIILKPLTYISPLWQCGAILTDDGSGFLSNPTPHNNLIYDDIYIISPWEASWTRKRNVSGLSIMGKLLLLTNMTILRYLYYNPWCVCQTLGPGGVGRQPGGVGRQPWREGSAGRCSRSIHLYLDTYTLRVQKQRSVLYRVVGGGIACEKRWQKIKNTSAMPRRGKYTIAIPGRHFICGVYNNIQ